MNINTFKKVNLRQKIVIITAIILIVMVVLVIFLIIPSIKNIKEIGENIKARRLAVEEKYLKGQSLKKLSQDLQIIEPQLNKLDQIFIDQNRALEFITSMEEIAEKTSINQKINLITGQKVNYNDYHKIPLQIFNQGNFIDQLNYLISIENLNYYINIKLLELTSNPAGKNEINMLIFADTYWK